LRASALVEVEGVRILIDCGPDFREQMIRYDDFRPIDGVLLTHEHYDHVGGVDDLRPYCAFGDITLYGDSLTLNDIRTRMPYCFRENLYPGVPRINLNEIAPHVPIYIRGIEVTPLQVMHGRLPILGYRIGRLAYITDLKSLPEEEWEYLQDVECLIVNALRIQSHDTHQSLEDALQLAARVGAKQTWFIHMSHQIGLHAEVEKVLPPNVHLAYDGLQIEV
jgi:phosphoribosyl 1,2-cyclic phosphate phosphodiesterase